jgi:hypothetical protein
VSLAAPPDENRYSLSTSEARRSTRIDRTVPLVVLGQTKTGLSFQEKTATVTLNLHGCRYATRHEYSVGTSVGLRVLQTDGESISPVIRAFVKSVHPPSNSRELFQVGVELEAPANIWNVSPAPSDWIGLLGGSTALARMATAVPPAFDSAATAVLPIPAIPSSSEAKAAQVAQFPLPSPVAAKAEPAKEQTMTRPERVAITIDQLVTAMQGKLQVAAEKVVKSALTMYLDEAVKNAVAKLEDARAEKAQQLEQFASERFETMLRASREEILGHLESRLGEVQNRWEEQHNAFRTQAEEIAQRLEVLASDTQRNLSGTQKYIEKVSRDIEPQTRRSLEESVGQVTEQFEAAADRISDRQLVRVMEATRMVSREAASQMDARLAETRASINNAANSTLDEFRRQTEVHVDLAVSEANERMQSAFSALDAENRAVCEGRRRALVEEVSRATEQSTEQFRSGMKAFLYSCLVAAVGAVDEHAKSTLDGLVKNPGSTPRTITEGVVPPSDEEKPN